MTDLTDAQRAARGEHAKRALEDFLRPAFDAVNAAYTDRIEELAAREPWSHQKISLLANARRISKEVQHQIEYLVHEGEHARAGIVRVEEIEKLSPAKRRFLNMAPF